MRSVEHHLTPDIEFCEECGSPVTVQDIPGQAARASSAVPVSPGVPLAVIPFAYQQRGVFSIDRCTIVVYPDQIILAYVNKLSEEEFDQAMTEVAATLMEKHLAGKNLWQVAAGAGFALFRLAWSPVDFYTMDAIQEKKMLRNITIPTRPWERYLSMAPETVLAEDKRNKAIPRESDFLYPG